MQTAFLGSHELSWFARWTNRSGFSAEPLGLVVWVAGKDGKRSPGFDARKGGYRAVVADPGPPSIAQPPQVLNPLGTFFIARD